jgi:hypothetical protein
MSIRPTSVYVAAALAAGLLLLSGLGCSEPDTTVDPGDFNRSCSVNEDCVALLFGDMCACRCDFGAINRADLAAYRQAVDAIECPDDGAACGACFPVEAYCGTDGSCAWRSTP